jgi:hypothetical protein
MKGYRNTFYSKNQNGRRDSGRAWRRWYETEQPEEAFYLYREVKTREKFLKVSWAQHKYCDGFAQGIAQQRSRGTQQDDATVLWKCFLRVGACTGDVMIYGACAGDVSSDCATVGDRFLLGGHQRTNEMPGWWWRGTWRDNTDVASGVFGGSARSARGTISVNQPSWMQSVSVVQAVQLRSIVCSNEPVSVS